MEYKPKPISDEDRAELAIRRETFDLSLAEIRARNGESYSERMKTVGGAATESAARQYDLEKSQ